MDIREAMEKAATHLEGGETEPAEMPAAEVEAAPEPAETETATETETDAQAAERARDEKGRFAPKDEAPKAAETTRKPAAAPKAGANGAASAPPAGQGKAAGASSPSTPAAAPASTVKAPQSWTPAAREAFAKAPPEVQREVERREREIARTLQETADVRKGYEQVQRTLAPYETIARANGMDAMSYAGSVLQTAAVLHVGTPQQKAQAFAALIQQFQPDLQAINAFLEGKAGPVPQNQPAARPVDIESLVNQKLEQARAKQDAESFLATKPEFLDDVRDDMLLVMQTARSQGRNMTWAEAYDRACKMNEGVQEALAQRKAAEATRTAQPVTDAARRAASSVRSQPAAPMRAQPKGIREAMEAAAEKIGM